MTSVAMMTPIQLIRMFFPQCEFSQQPGLADRPASGRWLTQILKMASEILHAGEWPRLAREPATPSPDPGRASQSDRLSSHHAEPGPDPTDSRESAMLAKVIAGNNPAVLSGKSGTAGIGVCEVYDLEQGLNVQLANVSTRGFVGAGENVLIGGVIVGPTDAPAADLIIRAIGPSLGDDGISGFLNAPIPELPDKNGAPLAENDNRNDAPAQCAAINPARHAPKHHAESP